MASQPLTSAFVADTAAISDVLPLDGITLIGLFSDSSGHAALLRDPDGAIARVTQGDSAFGLTVTAMDDTTIVVADARGHSQSLQIPGS